MTKILLICVANICRSPMATIVMSHMIEKAHLKHVLKSESAGTHAGRFSQALDVRAEKVLLQRGYAVGRHRSRQIIERDFTRFDLIFAMDQATMSALLRFCPAEHAHKLHMFLEFSPEGCVTEVPDPYYGAEQGFHRVLELCEIGAQGLIAHLKASNL